MSARELFDLLKTTYRKWSDDKAGRLGAALAFYAVFSLAPLLIIAIAIASLVFGEEAAKGHVADKLNKLIGTRAAGAVEETIERTHASGSGLTATIISIVVLFFSATAVFGQLQDALNTIWGVQSKPKRGWFGTIKDRLATFVVVLGFGALLLVSLSLSTTLAVVGQVLPNSLPGSALLWRGIELVVALVLFTLLFAMIYKFLPDVQLAWRDVIIGAFVTAVLLSIGKFLIGLYLVYGSPASAYGAAGSLVIILLWVYYSAQVMLFGAELTEVYASRYGQPFVQTDRAEPVTLEARARQGMTGGQNSAQA